VKDRVFLLKEGVVEIETYSFDGFSILRQEEGLIVIEILLTDIFISKLGYRVVELIGRIYSLIF
jgi:hypothetical protein